MVNNDEETKDGISVDENAGTETTAAPVPTHLRNERRPIGRIILTSLS